MLRPENWGITKPLHGGDPDPDHPRAGRLRGAWLFNDYPVPFVEDVSGWNNIGEFGAAGAAPSWAVGRNGGDWAVAFDGGDLVTVPDVWGVGEFPDGITVVAWVMQPGWAACSYVTKTPGCYNLTGTAAGALTFTVGAVAATSAAAVIPLNQWFQVVGTHDGATTRIYFNGVEVGNQANIQVVPTFAIALLFGAEAGPLFGLNGSIDHVLLYDCGFDAEEVRELREAPFAPFLIGYRFPLDEVVRPPGQSDTDWTMVRGQVKP